MVLLRPDVSGESYNSAEVGYIMGKLFCLMVVAEMMKAIH